jgi:16S rRNA processing protein RimM
MLLVVGHIGKPHGIRGELLVTVRTDEPEARFVAGSVFTTQVPQDRRVHTGPARAGAGPQPAGAAGTAGPAAGFRVPETLTLQSLRWHQGRVIAVFAGIDDRSVAEQLRGVLLCVDSADVAPPDDPDEFNDHQLIGLSVVSVDGEPLGDVVGIDHAPASDLIVVRRPAGNTALIPFVRQIVPDVDVAGGKVVVDPPGGLLDL